MHSPNNTVPRSLLGIAGLVTGLIVIVPCGWALSIDGYDSATNDVFSSGFDTTPIRNTSESFIAQGLDLSGVGWAINSGLPGTVRMHNTTMLTPIHAMLAKHYPITPGTPLVFVGSDNSLQTNIVARTSTVNIGGTTGTNSDHLIGVLASPFSATQNITPYRVLDFRDGYPSGQSGDGLVYGSSSLGSGPRLGAVNFYTRSSWSTSGEPGSAYEWESGDSGSPGFITYTAPDGSTSLHFVGTAYTARSVAGVYGYGADAGNFFTTARGYNAVFKSDGYALKWTIYDKTNDPFQGKSAARWDAPSGGELFNANNWHVPNSGTFGQYGTESVLLDSTTINANAPVVLNVSSPGTLRGILFKSGANENGFIFSGSSTLTLDRVGIRNESAATQTFNVPVALADSQNWEAVNGDLVFNGTITSGGHLIVVGGARDTTFNGVVSGSSGLAKDDAGVLTLNAANTYTGKTWIHGGTLRLGTGSLPSSAEVIFQTTNPAVLDLNGRNQQLASLRSVYGGTGEVRLGGATLSLGLTSASTFDGVITGNGTLAKGGSLFVVTGANTYSGLTWINNGVFRLGSAQALSPNTNLVINGGVLELGATDLAINIGNALGQLRFTGNGGFSAFGGDRKVTFNGGDILTWGVGGFTPGSNGLRFSASTADSMIELTNSIVLGTTGTGARIVTVSDDGARTDARLSGNISDSGTGIFALTKTGAGVLELTGSNTYRGATNINAGALRIATAGSLSASSNVVLNGGVLELGHADYSTSLGTGAGQVSFVGSGGFSAAGADRVVTLNGGAALTWGQTTDFLTAGNSLMLSSTGSDATVELVNPLVLGTSGSGTATVQVNNGSAKIDARLSGGISDGSANYSFAKTGAGTLEITGPAAWHGSTVVGGGVLRFAPATALPSGNLSLSGGGVLELTAGNMQRAIGTGANQVSFGAGGGGFSAAGADRIVALNGGAALVWGTENFLPSTGAPLVLSSDSSDATLIFTNSLDLGAGGTGRGVTVHQGSAAVDARITGNITSSNSSIVLSKSGAGTLELTGTNTYAGATWLSNGVLRLGSAGARSTNSNLILNGGILELGAGNLSLTLGSGAGQVQAWGDAVLAFSAAGATRNLTLNGGSTFRWGISYGASKALHLSSSSSDATLVLTNAISMENRGPENRTVHVHDGTAAVDARLSGVISQVGTHHGITKTGDGTLELTAANTYKGDTLVQAGRLLINGNQTSATGQVIIESGATLGGKGTVGGATVIRQGGMLDLGDTPGRLNFKETLMFESASVFSVTLNNGGVTAVSGLDYDHVAVSGQVSLGGVLLDLNLTSNFEMTAREGVVFTILSSQGLLGTTAQNGSTTVMLNDINYQFGIDQTDTELTLTLESISAVPEPAVAGFAAGLLVLSHALCRRRRC